MSQPPAKRRRTLLRRSETADESTVKVRKPRNVNNRFTNSSSIDKENQNPNAKTRASSKHAAGKPDPASPSKRAQSSKQNGTQKGSLDRFFQPSKDSSPYSLPSHASPVESKEDDAIQDELSDPDSRSMPIRRARPALKSDSSRKAPDPQSVTTKARAFSARPASQNAPSVASTLPWSEMYQPENLTELAVHKKKVADVRAWLSNVLSGVERKRLLVLEGPSGAGKSTTIQVLSRELVFEIVEWGNATDVSSTSEGYTSVVSRFDEFLNRSSSYSSLLVEDPRAGSSIDAEVGPPQDGRQRIIVLEEFPVTLPFNEDSLRAFRASVLQYLATSWSRSSDQAMSSLDELSRPAPVVMIVTESRTNASGSGSDGLTAHRLLGRDILDHPAVTSIEFNPIAPTLTIKALELVTRKEARHSGRRRSPGTEILKALSELGDLRNAIGCLEFLCKKGGKDGDWSGRIAAAKGSKAAPTKTELNAMRTIALRDSSITLFHAAGKVVYNKRITPALRSPGSTPPIRPPDFLAHHARPNASEVEVEKLMDETGADTGTFVATLHENFTLSCSGDNEVESLDDCLDFLSDSDLLDPDSTRRSGGSGRGWMPSSGRGAVEYLLQDEISFHTAARGLLFSLPYPVKRKAEGVLKSGDAFKMFYPTSLRLWKQLEQCKLLISRYSSRYLVGLAATAELASRLVDGADPASLTSDSRSNGLIDELVLERLPYLAQIARFTKKQEGLADLETITQFKGMEGAEGETGDSTEGLAANRGLFGGRPKQSAPKGLSELQSAGTQDSLDAIADKLVLSDDDIEDD